MKNFLIAIALMILCAGCAGTPPVQLSGPILEGDISAGDEGLLVGFVADSQLQTRRNYNVVPFYRGRQEDGAFNVSMRPPALDWAARYMLAYNLDQLAEGGAKAVFYLGDGANNGCYDEFALGFEDGKNPPFNDQGILRILADFRQKAGVPVYFVIGNHDILGAGSTSKMPRRQKFCEDKTDGSSTSLLKSRVIEIVDAFNKGNARFGSEWVYKSSYDSNAVAQDCGHKPEEQHRNWGCYLAATVDAQVGTKSLQFLLLDTTDFRSVSSSELATIDQEGMRGAMSFGTLEGETTVSQTSWFDENASQKIALRIALSHYDVRSLTKKLGPFQFSRKTQRYADLFLGGESGTEVLQGAGFAITGHTHAEENKVETITFKVNCGLFVCRPGGKVSITELNIGSTTDFTNYATLVRIAPGGEDRLIYERVETPPGSCGAVYDKMETFPFERSFRGATRGWKALGIDVEKSYRDFSFEELPSLWANLEEFVNGDPNVARCVGHYASAIEHGVDPRELN